MVQCKIINDPIALMCEKIVACDAFDAVVNLTKYIYSEIKKTFQITTKRPPPPSLASSGLPLIEAVSELFDLSLDTTKNRTYSDFCGTRLSPARRSQKLDLQGQSRPRSPQLRVWTRQFNGIFCAGQRGQAI